VSAKRLQKERYHTQLSRVSLTQPLQVRKKQFPVLATEHSDLVFKLSHLRN